MSQKLTIFRGDTPKGTINLYTQDPNTGLAIVYNIITGSQISIFFPGTTASVELSSANPGEVTVLNAAEGQIAYAMDSTKSDLLKLGDNQAIDVVVTTPSNDVLTAERVKIVKIVDRANP